MRPWVSRLLKLCVLGEFYARFSQVNETLNIELFEKEDNLDSVL